MADYACGHAYAIDVPHFTFVIDTALALHEGRLAQRVVRFFDAGGELVYRIDNAAPEVIR